VGSVCWKQRSIFLYASSVILLVLILIAVAGRASRPLFTRIACFSLAWLVLIFVLARSISGALPTGSYLQRFDPSIWQQPRKFVKGDITPRQKMLGDLVENVLPGRSRAEIKKLLGSPDDAADRELIYGLGTERDSMFPIDDETLVIRLDSSGRFASYYIYVD
jgi:hypothetical protein